MTVVILLPLELQPRRARCGRRKREVFIEDGLHVSCRFGRVLVAERAILELSEYYIQVLCQY